MSFFVTTVSVLAAGFAHPAPALEMPVLYERSETVEAPFATPELTSITAYRRTTPRLATGGRPTVEGYEAANAAGFGLVIDMRQPDEPGVAEETKAAERLGLERVVMPLPSAEEDIPAYLDDLAELLEDPANHPILLHCGSGNRVGAAWALYRIRNGVPFETALGEARAIGLSSREAMVRDLVERGIIQPQTAD